MLLKLEHIISATKLSANTINSALKRNGYDDTVKSANFAGMTTNGSFAYECTYADDSTGQDEDCRIYIAYDNFGKLVADY
jgi:hypothetical protein